MEKKIEIITTYFYPVYSGLEVNVFNTYSHLAKRGWDIVVHTTTGTHTQPDVLPSKSKVKGMRVFRTSFRKYSFISLTSGLNINEEKLICLHGVDILPNYFIYLQVILLKLLGAKRPKLVFTPHGIFDLGFSGVTSPKIWLKNLVDHSLGSFLINRSVSAVRAVSDWEKNHLVKNGINPDLIKVINNGLESEAFMNTRKKSSLKIRRTVKKLGTYFLQLGRIDEIKNQKTAIQALKLLPDNFNLALVGQDHNQQYKKELLRLVKKLKLENRVHFLGVIKGIDKYYLMRNALCMVHMSKLEGFCNVVHEALSQGLPCIVSDNTALTELIKNNTNGFTVDSEDYKKVAQKILFINNKSNKKRITKMKNTNIVKVKGHSWKNTALKVEQLYLSIIK
ncbi:hypothetical protein A2397_02425 [Candidatus Amesbacteria bacterium RIFOXYB1_FULL_44_23]|uniref:Glycosyl transferase family 1 domain-containing protein n=1 Tax=Candidatus Amesbacteria bacterium RIFOXYB1_FULL_44_23 TaxID=1797263 RepID=A0A1F4ZVH1_9BACT|nr:MAG: hypothetical protein A2397_02425 [Candidatus Amesbacteria bacterium RIFOXYB1_FULL_44_23]